MLAASANALIEQTRLLNFACSVIEDSAGVVDVDGREYEMIAV
jgi:hypothetical protein